MPRTLLYDTTVYVDILQGRFPKAGELAIRAADAWHSTVTEAELIAPCLWTGVYGPADRRRVLNDALIFATARKHGMAVLTRNIDDFDFLLQVAHRGKSSSSSVIDRHGYGVRRQPRRRDGPGRAPEEKERRLVKTTVPPSCW